MDYEANRICQQGPQSLLVTGSRTAHFKVTVNVGPDRLNCCVISVVRM